MQTDSTQVLDIELPRADLRECSWWQPRTIDILGEPAPGDLVLQRLLPQLIEAFRAQGHIVHDKPSGSVHLMLALYDLPDNDKPIAERLPEREMPLGLTLMREYGLVKRPENLVVLLSIHERLGHMPHMQVIELARTVAARIGTPKVVFVSGDRKTGRIYEATYCTLEGGHPTDTSDIAARLADRLISMSCARDVGGDYRVVENAIPRSDWLKSRTPEALIEAGHRMDALHLLPAPKRVSDYVTPGLARIYERYLGMKGFSEGMLFSFDPETRTVMVTASGSWEVDKRALRREEIVPIGGLEDGKMLVYAPEGIKPKGPSVEALEMYTLLQSVPTVRLTKNQTGVWVLDPKGQVEAPIIRGGVHVHVGVKHINEEWVENIPPNRQEFPYGFGCGTDLMKELARNSAHRSRAIADPSDPRCYARWQMLYHGDTVIELWKPGLPDKPLAGLLDMYDPQRVGAIQYTPDHIDQP